MLNESFVLPLPRNTTRRLCHWPGARDLFVLTLATTRVLENIDDTKEHVKEVKTPIYPPRKWNNDYVIQQHLNTKSLALVRKQQGLRDISWKGDQGNRKLIPAEEGTEGETRVIFSPPLSKVCLSGPCSSCPQLQAQNTTFLHPILRQPLDSQRAISHPCLPGGFCCLCSWMEQVVGNMHGGEQPEQETCNTTYMQQGLAV